MQTGAGAARKDTFIIRRHVNAPIAFLANIEIDDLGCFYGLEIDCRADASPQMRYALTRAAWFVNGEMYNANAAGDLSIDVLARLPPCHIADVERAMLIEIAAVQRLYRPSAMKGGRHGGQA